LHGLSGSLHPLALNVNEVLKAVPITGVIAKVPGKGAPFVVIVIPVLSDPHDSLKLSNDRSGRIFADKRRFIATGSARLALQEAAMGVRAADLRSIVVSSTSQRAKQSSTRSSVPVRNSF